ncbi:putative DNA-binding protein (MmcQ/YjbR family) [Frondihabitans australicus]|uniref:Putative DNA-binding protein (MmcQ/YjbR family) n=2 Tax=Frondihabitans australicus TaxID=386892 RepID=A0A495IL68_9MICO|nr:putative DNA-binding protein (MmcQ/YjbR family) [Frondihabitans australicus]
MNDDEALEFCQNLPSAELTHPFGFETAVMKVRGRVFAILPLHSEVASITLKSEPADAEALVREHAAVTPGYHMNKRHWITVTLDGSLPDGLDEELIRESYRLVIAALPKARRPVA